MSSENQKLKERSDAVFANTYARYPVALVKGSGCIVEDAEGKEYLDFLAGIAVCSLGHCHPQVTEAVCRQAKELVHVSNLYYTGAQTELAEMLVENSFADKVFLANSGAEANEGALKLARYAAGPERYEIISLMGSFHGRTLATLTMTGQPKFHEGFEPAPEGFSYAPFGDLDALEKMISSKTCAIICEPLQGEGGVRPLDKEYVRGIRELCDKYDLFLIFDEIQTGIGRTGTLFGYEQLGVKPDIMTLAKALGNGLPIGAMLTTEKIASAFGPGSHGSTFGGNQVSSAAAVETLKIMLADGFLSEVQEKGEYLQGKLKEMAAQFPIIATSARGMGLLRGLVLTDEFVPKGAEIVNKMFGRGYLMNFAGNTALRFAPPLVVTKEEIDKIIAELTEVFAEYE